MNLNKDLLKNMVGVYATLTNIDMDYPLDCPNYFLITKQNCVIYDKYCDKKLYDVHLEYLCDLGIVEKYNDGYIKLLLDNNNLNKGTSILRAVLNAKKVIDDLNVDQDLNPPNESINNISNIISTELIENSPQKNEYISVPSFTNSNIYYEVSVQNNNVQCTCESFIYNKDKLCKHMNYILNIKNDLESVDPWNILLFKKLSEMDITHYYINSESSNIDYEVSVYKSGKVTCECKDYFYKSHSSKDYKCKHIKSLSDEELSPIKNTQIQEFHGNNPQDNSPQDDNNYLYNYSVASDTNHNIFYDVSIHKNSNVTCVCKDYHFKTKSGMNKYACKHIKSLQHELSLSSNEYATIYNYISAGV
jgi:hypothetical protein